MEEEKKETEPRYSTLKKTPVNPFRENMPAWYPNTKKLYVLIKEWKNYVGEFFYNNSILLGVYKEGILSVACKNSMISYEMNLNKKEIIDRINAKHGADYIVNITFNNSQYIKEKEPVEKEEHKEDFENAELSLEKVAEIEDLIKNIEDGPLKERMRRVYINYAKSVLSEKGK